MRDQHRDIHAIFGFEPNRDNEYPVSHTVGLPLGRDPSAIVTEIKYRERNYGDHGVGWFDVWVGDWCAISMQARAVAEVHYVEEK